MLPVTLIDYGVGNTGSVANMFKRIGVPCTQAARAEDILAAKALLLPGVGAFGYCMEQFNASGLRPALEEAVLGNKTPILGICVGFQMLFEHSDEGDAAGLGWLHGKVVRFDSARLEPRQKIPHMGWNYVQVKDPHPLFEGMERPRFYFVHSYHPQVHDTSITIAECDYGYRFPCAVEQGNIRGVQFHPEKSHRYGMRLLQNYSRIAAGGAA